VDDAALDGLLKARWDAMRQSLIGGDIVNASSYFKSSRTAAYTEFFQLIPVSQISAVIPGPDKMDLIEILESKARYVTEIDILINDTPATANSFIIFTKDENGLWKISFF
jgi:hypothetical protein